MKRVVKRSISVLLTVLMLCSMVTITLPTSVGATASAYEGIREPENLVPADVFASKEKTQQWFDGSVAGTYSVENGEYVYTIPTSYTDIYTKQELPDDSFTVKMDIRPKIYTNSQGATAYGGMGILLGYDADARSDTFPWMNVRFDIDYATKAIDFYIWEHNGTNGQVTVKHYGTSWYQGEFPEDLWFEVTFEFTPTKTKIYLDGYQTPDFKDGFTPSAESLGHFPTIADLAYIGAFPSSAAYDVKNFGIYEGVDLRFNSVPENLFYSNETASTYFHKVGTSTITSASTYTVEDGEYVMYLPHESAWTVSNELPSGPFTIEFELKPTILEGATLPGSAGIMLGTAASGVNDWIDVQLRFRTAGTTDGLSYSADGLYAYEWLNPSSGSQTSKMYNTSSVLTGSDYVITSKWYNVRIEVGQDGSKMYVDGALLPEALLEKLPTCETIKMFGLWPAGSTGGYYIKNYKIFEGVPENLVPEDLFANYDTAKAWFTNVQQVNAYDQSSCYTVDSNGDYVMRVPVVSNGGAWISDNRTIPYDSYTVSVDFSPNVYGESNVGGAGFQVGEVVTSGYRFHQLRFNFDKAAGTMSFRGHAQGSDPDHTYSGGIDYIDGFTVIREGIDFSTKQWFNLTAEVTGNSIQVFLDGEQLFVEKIDRLPAAEDIAYFGFMAEGGTAGYDVKNFSIYEGVEGEIKTAAPELNEAITLHYSADVDADAAESVRMKFTFKGEDIWVDGVLSGDQYTFALPDILPQDMCENISAQLYIDGMRKDKVATYSLQQYCMNIMPSAEDAAADETKQKLRNVLIAMLNYGTESQKYFEGITDETLFANSQLEDSEKVSVNQAMTNAGTVRNVSTRSDENNYWKSASLALFNTVRLRFKFVTNDASKITIKVEGDDQTYTNFDVSTGNVYYWDYDQVYANQFDKEVKVGLYVDGDCVQTVTYSINSYVNAFVGANDAQSNSYALIQAVYDYGCMASAYNA